MLISFDFLIGFGCCGLLIGLFLLYRLIEIFRELVSILKEELKDE